MIHGPYFFQEGFEVKLVPKIYFEDPEITKLSGVLIRLF